MRFLVRAADTVVRYVVWLLLFGLGLWALLETRINLFDILVRVRFNGWAIPAITNFYLAIVIVVWLAVAIWLENYLTEPKDTRIFWRRTIRILAIEATILLASYGIQSLL